MPCTSVGLFPCSPPPPTMGPHETIVPVLGRHWQFKFPALSGLELPVAAAQIPRRGRVLPPVPTWVACHSRTRDNGRAPKASLHNPTRRETSRRSNIPSAPPIYPTEA